MLACPSARAQHVQVDAYVGLSFAYLNGTEETATSGIRFISRITFPFGVNLDIPLSENLLLGTGLGYSPRGTTVESSGYSPYPIGPSLSEISLNYIDIPAVLVLSPSTFRLFVGPQFSFLTSASASGRDFTSAIEGTSFGIRYGLGFDSSSIVFRITGQNGFTDVFKHPTNEWTTHAYTFSVGYLLVKRREGAGAKSKKKDEFVPEHRKLDF